MKLRQRLGCWPLALGAALTIAAPAAAEPKSQPNDADALFAEARRLLSEGKPEQACPKFEQSQKLDPAAGTLINLARCYARIGRTASAWAAYRTAAAQSEAAGQTKRESVARAQADALELELAKVKLTLPGGPLPEGLEFLLDGAPWLRGAPELAAPVDPGAHTLVARAPGFAEWSQAFEATPREQMEIHVPALRELSAAPAVALPKDSSASLPSSPSSAARTSTPLVRRSVESSPASGTGTSKLRPLGLVIGGVGIVGLGASVGFGLRAQHLNSESRRDGHCEPGVGCDPQGLDLNRRARDAGAISTAFFVSGAALCVAGVTLYLLGEKTHSSSLALTLSPVSTARGTSLVLYGGL